MSKYGQITLYACGGAGVNVAKFFEKYRKTSQDDHPDDQAFARITPVYIDTSRSNLRGDVPEESTYVIQGLDGSGKVRRENADAITQCTLDILQKHKPANVSIVISSAAGGSGSVIAPSIVSELLERGKTVIVCAIGSEDSRIELENTSKTIKTYESIAKMRKKPVIMLYASNNDNEAGRVGVDAEITQAITKIAALYSKHNRELDSKDLDNWIFYNNVTSFAPKLCFLDFYPGKITNLKNGQVVSVATLCLDGMSSSTGMTVEYQAVGYVTEEQNKKTTLTSALHYVILDNIISDIHAEISDKLHMLDEQQRARISKQSILSDSDRSTSNGLIL